MLAVLLVVVLAVTTIWGAMSSNYHYSEPYRTLMVREQRMAETLSLDLVALRRGKQVFQASCTVCHGPKGDGVHGLGKPIHNSAFVQESSHDELFELLVDGRKLDDPRNTTGVLMPPRAAKQLGDDQINDVIVYLRSLQEPGATLVSVEPWNIKARMAEGGAEPIELTDHPGFDLFIASCSSCHGRGAQGLEGQALPLVTSGYVRGTSDQDLISFIKRGRPMWDADNTTGLDMPPKGGNPAITDDQLQSIVDYMRALQKEAMGS
ncbi:MAG: c-type cytochrome [Phycisphaerales bacterium]|nr:c-type cytochrome [Phycisphaerales bacterium]